MTSDHQLTTEISTRTLIEALIRTDATVDSGELYAVATALGMSDQQVRLCVKRLTAEGRFTREGRGRGAVLRATELTRSTIEPDRHFLRLMYAQDRGQASWDGRWRILGFGVPESARQARDAMRDTVLRLGGAPIQGGLYVSANAWDDLIRSAADTFGIAEHLTMLTTSDLAIGSVREPRALATQLWPLDRLAEGHRRLLTAAEGFLTQLRTAGRIERLRIAIALAVEFTRAMEPDPLLPPQLLPQPWIGTAARSAVAACWAELLTAEPNQPIRLFRWYAEPATEMAEPAAGSR